MPRRRLTRTARTITRDLDRTSLERSFGDFTPRGAHRSLHRAIEFALNRVRSQLVRHVIAIALFLSLAIASPANAYVRTIVDGFPERPIFWMDRTIDVELSTSTLPGGVSDTDLRTALDRSIATWTHAGDCTDIVLTDVGEALGRSTNLDGGALDHHNRIVVRTSDWPAIVAPETLALTTVLYDRSSGSILDADTDLNASQHTFSASEVPPSGDDDLQNTLTHEMGHLLGFAHSPDVTATMYASAQPGETSKRDLAPDDVHAICETYPTGAMTPTTVPPMNTSSCAVSRDRSISTMWIALAALIIQRAARRSRRAARADETAS